MKICVTSEGRTLDSKVDPRFGRCPNFLIYETDTGRFETEANAHAQFPSGAGIQSGQFIASKGVKAVLTGNVGPNAHKVLAAAGIEVLTGVTGTVQEAIERYRSGACKPAVQPTVESKFGMSNN